MHKIAATLLTSLIVITSYSQQLPDKDEILTDMVLANEYFMKKWPDVGKTIITNRERPSNIWTRAVYYEGLMALYQIKPDERYYTYAVDWGEFHNWSFWGRVTTRNADHQCCGQTYIDLYNVEKKPERIIPIKTCIDSMLHSDKVDDWWWIDALQMAMPIFAKLGVLYNDTAYFNKMFELYNFTKNKHGEDGLYNTEDHLWWRDANYKPPYTEPNGEDCYWSRGNGWVIAALVRVLDILPESDPHYQEYLTTFIEMSEELAELQRDDGFWNVSLHDPTRYNGPETTGTALFTYGFAWGINNNILSRDRYYPLMVKAWNGMSENALHENGFLGYVQSTGPDPSTGQPVTYDKQPDFEDYGLGCFLLAGSEVYKLAE